MADDLSKYSILIVDDDSAIREIYESFFHGAGLTTFTAKDGAEGLAVAKEHTPSIILLDVMMPNMDGREALRRIKSDASLKNIPVIMFSALITELEKEDSLASGASAYLEKSEVEDPEQLLDKVKALLKVH
jgi:CheY-like chemotaxis protein